MPDNSLEVTNDEQLDVVDQAPSQNEFALVEDSHDDQPEIVDQEVEEPERAKKQSREDNHAAKAARLQAERAAKAEIEKAKQEAYAEFENKLKASGVKNPYTDENFKSFDEFLEYGRKVTEAEQRDRAESEGKTIEEIQQEDADKEYLAKKRQEDSERATQEEENNNRQAFLKADIADFMERYPEVDIANLVVNKSFLKFAGSRFEKEPLADLYTDFADLVGEAEANGRAKDTRGARSTGSGSDAGVVLTAAQKRDLEDWNRKNPDMKMTPKEFLGR